jgi:hypothetical protein
MKIQQRASKSWAKTSRTAALPKWTNLLGVALLVVVVIGLVVRTSHPSSSIPTVPNTIPPVTTTSTPATTTTSYSATTSLRTTSNTSRTIPTPALVVAREAAAAVYTGNISNIPMTPSAVYNAPYTYSPDPSVTSPTVSPTGTTTLTFYFQVVTSPGTAPVNQVITVTDATGSWQWVGEAA